MKEPNLSRESIMLLNELRDDIDRLFSCKSNIELIWELEKLHNDKAFLKSAEYIRKSLNK